MSTSSAEPNSIRHDVRSFVAWSRSGHAVVGGSSYAWVVEGHPQLPTYCDEASSYFRTVFDHPISPTDLLLALDAHIVAAERARPGAVVGGYAGVARASADVIEVAWVGTIRAYLFNKELKVARVTAPHNAENFGLDVSPSFRGVATSYIGNLLYLDTVIARDATGVVLASQGWCDRNRGTKDPVADASAFLRGEYQVRRTEGAVAMLVRST